MTTLHITDARGCQLHATRADGSPIVTVRGEPLRSGAVSWRLPSLSAMHALAEDLREETEALELISFRDASITGESAIRTFYARSI